LLINQANLIHEGIQFRLSSVKMCGFQGVKRAAQHLLFFALAVFLRAALQRHVQSVVADEMRAVAGLQQTYVCGVGAHITQVFRRHYASGVVQRF